MLVWLGEGGWPVREREVGVKGGRTGDRLMIQAWSVGREHLSVLENGPGMNVHSQ